MASRGSLAALRFVPTLRNVRATVVGPGRAAPGTIMSFAGLKKPADRVNLIAYLDSLGG